MALGMDSNRIVKIFTLEGCLAAVWALVVALLLGVAVFYLVPRCRF